jgi:hypothetical protein
MFLWMMIALALLTVPLAGGRLGNLARLHLRAVWAVVVAVTIQLLVITVFPHGDTMLHAVAHMLSYAVGAVFLVANRRLDGIWLAAVGATLNALVIALNGGVMPASVDALRRAGIQINPAEFENSRPISDAKLGFLGDIFAWPTPMPFSNVFSIGDLLLVLGVAVIVHSVCGSRVVPRVLRSRAERQLVPEADAVDPEVDERTH